MLSRIGRAAGGLISRTIMWGGGSYVAAQGFSSFASERGKVMKAYYGDAEYQEKYKDSANAATNLATGIAWYMGVTGALGLNPATAVLRKLGRVGTAPARAVGHGLAAGFWRAKAGAVIRPGLIDEIVNYQRMGHRLSRRTSGTITQKIAQASRMIERRDLAKSRLQIKKAKRALGKYPGSKTWKRVASVTGWTALAGGGAGLGASLRPMTSMGPGNITSFDSGVSDKMNFSTAGLMSALHNSRRRLD